MIPSPRPSWVLFVVLFASGLVTTRAQQPPLPRGPAFEVASVKPNESGGLGIQIDTPGTDRFTATNVPLRDLIRFAFDVQDIRLVGGPDWIRSERFDIVAKAEQPFGVWGPSGPPMPLLVMVRTLLADRFSVAVHQETRELPVYALVAAREDRKLGPEIAPSKLDCENQAKAGPAAPRPPLGTRGGGDAQPTCGMRIAPGQMVMGGTPMSQFATVLSNFVQRVVLDRTQLAGTFDFHLSWTPERILQGAPPPGAPPLPPVDPNGASLFAALQEQLGLKLESTRAPLEVLIIDRAERPTPD
jgi:bla regulator protein blaR1